MKNLPGVSALLICLFAAVVALAVPGCGGQDQAQTSASPTQIAEPEQSEAQGTPETANPLTGNLDYNSKAIGKRPVAVVVENHAQARPQWNMNTPDIILEGEIEHGEGSDGTDSRMLWFYADYTSLPSKVGPMRSARPPFIKFSELFDSVFIHWGMSHSKGKYVGAATVFKKDKVDHINQMEFKGDSTLMFGRDTSRNVDSWHTAYLKGKKVPDGLKLYKFRTDIDEDSFTRLPFAAEAAPMSGDACTKVKVKLSKKLNHSTTWTYKETDSMYHSKNYEQDSKVDNVVVLFDKTKYVEKKNYMGAGSFDVNSTTSQVYTDYKLAGGKGYVASRGTVVEITWNADGGKLHLLGADGKELTLNPGRTWIGWASANKGGKVKLS